MVKDDFSDRLAVNDTVTISPDIYSNEINVGRPIKESLYPFEFLTKLNIKSTHFFFASCSGVDAAATVSCTLTRSCFAPSLSAFSRSIAALRSALIKKTYIYNENEEFFLSGHKICSFLIGICC